MLWPLIQSGWFALAPLGLEVAASMGTCENQLYPPTTNPKRPAYLKFKNLKSGLAYCQYGVVKEDGKPKDCQEVPPNAATEEELQKYRPQVLTSCVCTPGTECKSVIGNAGVASVASTIFVRISLGTLLERLGPVNVQCGLMTFGAFWVDTRSHSEVLALSIEMLVAVASGKAMMTTQLFVLMDGEPVRPWRPQSRRPGTTP